MMEDKLKNVAYTTEYKEYRKTFYPLFEEEPEPHWELDIDNQYKIEEMYYGKVGTRCRAIRGILKDANNNIIAEIESIRAQINMSLIHHRNGKDYMTYNIDLYGHSIMDMTTMKSVDFIPERCFKYNGIDEDTDKTFIWAYKHYCPKNNLLVVEGYIEGTSDSGLGFYDFSNPMSVPLPMYLTSYDLAPYIPNLNTEDVVEFDGFTDEGKCKLTYSDKNDLILKKITLDIIQIAKEMSNSNE